MDPIANFLTSIRNASAKGLEKTDSPLSKIKMGIAKILKEEGYISNYRLMEENKIPFIRVQLRYTDAHKPIIGGIRRVSRPGLRIYQHWHQSVKFNAGLGIAILSTSNGLMTTRKARQLKLGGEVLCAVW